MLNFWKLRNNWFPLEEGPGIEGFSIYGDAKLGGKLIGCGYGIRGTSLCLFQVKKYYSIHIYTKFISHKQLSITEY